MPIPIVRRAFSVFLLTFISAAVAQLAIPDPSRRVTDLTATLTPDRIAALEEKLQTFENEKGSQIAVLMVATTQPEDIAEFGIRVAEAWQIGRKNIDDGVILIVAKDDRKLRLEVGYGLEGVIPDAVARRVIDETITPHFKQGDFAGGIDAGVTRLMQLIRGEALPAPERQPDDEQHEGAFMFILVSGLFAGAILSAVMGRFLGSLIAGLGSTAAAAVFLGLGFAVVLGFMVFILLLGGFTHGGGGGGGWSSGGGFRSSGSGSWGGGGGRFGGGGASGSW
ncbi:MAG: TPM domain-containing protein [Gammaproteobacteria bacterium]